MFQADLQQQLNKSLCTDDCTPDTLLMNLKSITLRTSADAPACAKEKTIDCFCENYTYSGLISKEEGSTSGPHCTTNLSHRESCFSSRLQHHAAQTQKHRTSGGTV